MHNKNIFSFIENSIKRRPSTVAISDGINDITYAQMMEKLEIIANNLCQRVVYRDSVVIYASKSISYVLLMVTLVKMGVTYIPVDTRTPIYMVKKITKEVNAKYIITDLDVNIDECSLLFINELEKDMRSGIQKVGQVNVNSDDIIYIICTSGSSSEPKGVMIEHRNLINLINSLSHCVYQNRVNDRSCRIAVMASFAFDASVKQIYMALCNAYTLVICPDKIKSMGRFAIEFLKKNKIDVLDITPSLISAFLLDRKVSSYKQLSLLLVGGELFREKHVDQAKSLFGEQVTIVNLYGPTECCVDVAYYVVPKGFTTNNPENILPIGYPLENLDFCIDEQSRELSVIGESVGRGYTGAYKEAFGIELDGRRRYKTGDICCVGENGLYYVLGRLDNQIKLRGFRIELEAIDNTIMQISGVTAAISFYINEGSHPYICTYVKANCCLDEVKEYIRSRLPDYMLPTFMYLIEENVVLNINGKLDRNFYKKQFLEHNSGELNKKC